MTHGKQEATSNMMVELLGEGSSAQIVSRSVAKGESRQVFHPRLSERTVAMHMFSVILLSWIMQK
mgnify:FL=1